ncbi:TcfC E-set like domain-containing protein [Photobacterium damselae]|uniref:TcfC E-set like domain-containing protein n=1 Tax=Photobacterium damselae TaxID=38293 RepID=UPI0030F38DAF
MNKYSNCFVLFCLCFNNNAFSFEVSEGNIPDEFKEIFKEKTKPVRVEFPNGDVHEINLTVSFGKVRFDRYNKKDKDKLYNLLKNNNVKDNFAKSIVNEMSKPEGMTNSDKCQGFLNTCIVLTDSYDVVYDSDRNTLRFFFSKEILNEKIGKAEYASSINNNPASINNSAIFVNASGSDASITFNDSFIQGFKYGYLDSEFRLSSDDDNELNKLAYNLDLKNKRYQLGYFSDENSMNSTDFIESFTDSDVLEISFGSSNNLLLKTSDSNKKIQIYVPSSGLLSIKKNGSYIKQYPVKSGQQNILYSSLPSGIYEINITVKSGNKIVFDENYNVYNTKGGQLLSKEMDYRFQFGLLQDGTDNEIPEFYNGQYVKDKWKSFDDKSYATGKISYGLTDAMMLGSAITIADDSNSVYQLGLNYLISESGSIRATSKLYGKGSYLFDVYLYSSFLNFGLSKFELDDNDFFAAYTEDYESNTSINISRMFNLGLNSTLGLYYNYSKYDKAESSNLSGNISYLINGNSRVDFQTTYNKYDNHNGNSDDSVKFDLSYTYDFDSGFSSRTTLNASDDGYNEITAEYDSGDLISDDDLMLSLVGRTSIQNNRHNNTDSQSSLDINGSYINDYLSSGYYGTIDSNGITNQSLTLTSNQILSKSGLVFTNKTSDAYLEFDIEKTKDIKDNVSFGTLAVTKDGSNRYDIPINSSNKLITLDSYAQYNNKVDTLSSSIENAGSKGGVVFSYPGTVGSVRLDLTKVVSFIGAYSDIFDQDIANLSCEGDGCVDVENIESNIYKVAVRSGKEFVLKDGQNKYVCLTPQVRNIEVLNIGHSFCVPEIDAEDYPIALKDPTSGDNLNLVYLGIFKDNNKWKYASLLKNKNYELIEKEFGDGNNLVYVNIQDINSIPSEFHNELAKVIAAADIPRSDISKYVLLLNENWN